MKKDRLYMRKERMNDGCRNIKRKRNMRMNIGKTKQETKNRENEYEEVGGGKEGARRKKIRNEVRRNKNRKIRRLILDRR